MDGADQDNIVPIVGAVPSGFEARYIHSGIFDRLYTEEDDLVGLIAYGLYQKQKRVWIKNFENESKKSPTVSEVQLYCSGFSGEVLIDLRGKAERILFGMTQNMVEDQTVEMQSVAFNAEATKQLSELNAKINEISGYKHHIIGHIVGFVCLVMLVWLASVLVEREPHLRNFFISPATGSPLPH